MASITDGEIRKTIARVGKTGKQETLADGEGRGTGRLVLIVKKMPSRVTADWFAQQWRDGKRVKQKLGSYPALSLGEARDVFRRDYSLAIQRCAPIKMARSMATGTVSDLFTSYVSHLRSQDKSATDNIERMLRRASEHFGPDRLARDVAHDEVIMLLRSVFDRGSPAMAEKYRAYIRAAYTWAMKAERDYRVKASRRFSITNNPAADIPGAKSPPGMRWLDEGEWVTLWHWLGVPHTRNDESCRNALRVVMLTGQRVREICGLHADQFNRKERTLDWATTKNGRPHSIPLPDLAFDLLASITPCNEGWLFPLQRDASSPTTTVSLHSYIRNQGDRVPVAGYTNRDLRRTWKTLSGKAGLSKEIRDRIQNHALSDIGSVHYDRYEYMAEKRAAMETWNRFVCDMIAAHSEGRQAA